MDIANGSGDFYFKDQGKVCLLTPLSILAKVWMGMNIRRDAIWQEGSLLVDQVDVDNIIAEILEARLTILGDVCYVADVGTYVPTRPH